MKAMIAPYLLQIQHELDDGIVGKLFGDQRTAREYYLMSIRPFMGPRPAEELAGTKKP